MKVISEPTMAPPPLLHEEFQQFCRRHEIDPLQGIENLANELFEGRYNDHPLIYGTVSLFRA